MPSRPPARPPSRSRLAAALVGALVIAGIAQAQPPSNPARVTCRGSICWPEGTAEPRWMEELAFGIVPGSARLLDGTLELRAFLPRSPRVARCRLELEPAPLERSLVVRAELGQRPPETLPFTTRLTPPPVALHLRLRLACPGGAEARSLIDTVVDPARGRRALCAVRECGAASIPDVERERRGVRAGDTLLYLRSGCGAMLRHRAAEGSRGAEVVDLCTGATVLDLSALGLGLRSTTLTEEGSAMDAFEAERAFEAAHHGRLSAPPIHSLTLDRPLDAAQPRRLLEIVRRQRALAGAGSSSPEEERAHELENP